MRHKTMTTLCRTGCAGILACCISMDAFTQSVANWGRTRVQTEEQLPHSRTTVKWPERPPRQDIPCTPEKQSAHDYLLNTGWMMANEKTALAARLSVFDPDTTQAAGSMPPCRAPY